MAESAALTQNPPPMPQHQQQQQQQEQQEQQQQQPQQQHQLPMPPPRLSVAPMVAVTDGPYRTLARLLSRRTLLYTEMLPADVVVASELNGDDRGPFPNPASLRLSESAWADAAGPLAVQLGGADPETMAEAARRIVAAYPSTLTEININCGCPSQTVAENAFGASLMRNPARVQALAAAVRGAVPAEVDVTVKMRLGVDEHDSWEQLVEFVEVVSAPPASVCRFVVHARKAILGLSTAQNRAVPPLRWDWVARLCKTFPHLGFELNGGVASLDEVGDLLFGEAGYTGVMIGRAARDNPWGVLADADRRIFGCPSEPEKTLRTVAVKYATYADGLLYAQQAAMAACEDIRRRPHERSELRKRLYAPLVSLFFGHAAAASQLAKAFERKSGVAKAAKSALQVVPAVPNGHEQLDAQPDNAEMPFVGG
ncbi:unnamed protein product [Polarella glacialis]|uniref:DUS-like FMN-binding domain-containing protein n=1 Tax=Polarella glacialis TaxID=89957 RepID=A0A813KYC8_POLGL|nr:unnamed protein product [Polarella glacialis]